MRHLTIEKVHQAFDVGPVEFAALQFGSRHMYMR